jgi:ribonuclease HI
MKQAKHNGIKLIRVPRHMGIDRNEMADELARQGSSHPQTGPEPVFGVLAKVARKVIRG